MINTPDFSKIILIASTTICLVLLLIRLREFLTRPLPPDRARPKQVQQLVEREGGVDLETHEASPLSGVFYAFTLGMAPWEKESTRIHLVGYARGILLHVGVLSSLALLVVSLFVTQLWSPLRVLAIILTGIGAISGLGATLWRFIGHNERRLSFPDDFASVILVTSFVVLTCWWLFAPSIQPWWYLLSSLMLLYIPFSKIRHFMFFFFTRLFFGNHFGRRGVLPPEHTKVSSAHH